MLALLLSAMVSLSPSEVAPVEPIRFGNEVPPPRYFALPRKQAWIAYREASPELARRSRRAVGLTISGGTLWGLSIAGTFTFLYALDPSHWQTGHVAGFSVVAGSGLIGTALFSVGIRQSILLDRERKRFERAWTLGPMVSADGGGVRAQVRF